MRASSAGQRLQGDLQSSSHRSFSAFPKAERTHFSPGPSKNMDPCRGTRTESSDVEIRPDSQTLVVCAEDLGVARHDVARPRLSRNSMTPNWARASQPHSLAPPPPVSGLHPGCRSLRTTRTKGSAGSPLLPRPWRQRGCRQWWTWSGGWWWRWPEERRLSWSVRPRKAQWWEGDLRSPEATGPKSRLLDPPGSGRRPAVESLQRRTYATRSPG